MHGRITDGPRGSAGRVSSRVCDLLYPLNLVYEACGLTLPIAREIPPDSIPAPYHSLLVHECEMTATLERYFGGELVLRTLSVMCCRGWFLRRVLLVQPSSGRPVEMGTIRVRLDPFPPTFITELLRNEAPFGRLIRNARIKLLSRPKAFLLVEPNQEMMGLFWMREPNLLYGRRTEVFHDAKRIGDIVEILPHL